MKNTLLQLNFNKGNAIKTKKPLEKVAFELF